jgi:hypothetical protein
MAGTTGLEPATSAVTGQGSALEGKGLQPNPFIYFPPPRAPEHARTPQTPKTDTFTDTFFSMTLSFCQVEIVSGRNTLGISDSELAVDGVEWLSQISQNPFWNERHVKG